jgi:hypothetical protein
MGIEYLSRFFNPRSVVVVKNRFDTDLIAAKYMLGSIAVHTDGT